MTSTTARENVVVVAAVMGGELKRSKVEISDLSQTVRCHLSLSPFRFRISWRK